MTTILADPISETPIETWPQPYHWTVDAFYRAYDAGVFENPERLELIHGRIIEKMPQKPRHSSLITQIAQKLREKLLPVFVIREEKPIRLSFNSEPEPDIAVVKGNIQMFYERHPTPDDTLLLVEVSDTTTVYNTVEKAMLYAQAGIADYWVVLAGKAAILIHRDPSPEGYGTVTKIGITLAISPLAVPDVTFTVGELLGTVSNE